MKPDRSSKTEQKPALKFTRLGDKVSFISSGMAGFQDINPITIVRELLQNSLDAAWQADREPARVRFELVKHPLAKVPCIKSYEKAFHKAKQCWKKLSAPEKNIVRKMDNCLEKTECNTLYILDNGIGLDQESMHNLLGEGNSNKPPGSTGAIGNGHLSALPASDLRYVLYGGRNVQGKTIGAGHAILASHAADDGTRMGKDGYLVMDLRDDFDIPYEFPVGDEIPDYIRCKLDWIAKNWDRGAGTVVAIPGFDNFRESEESLKDMIFQAAARNFFPVFAEEKLVLEVVLNGNPDILDYSSITEVLEGVRSETNRSQKNKFLPGAHAYSAFRTIKSKGKRSVKTDFEDLDLKISLDQEERKTSRIDLCRNGMWITDELPNLGRSHFSDRKKFHCVVLVKHSDKKINSLFVQVEGVLHNGLTDIKNMDKSERDDLNKVLKKIREKLMQEVPKLPEVGSGIPDVLCIHRRGMSVQKKGRHAGRATDFSEISKHRQSKPERPDPPNPPKPPVPSPSPIKGDPVSFEAIPVLARPGAYKIEIHILEEASNIEAWFSIDNNFDPTWDSKSTGQFVKVSNIRINQRKSGDRIIHKGKGVSLRGEELNDSVTLEFDFDSPEGMKGLNKTDIVLKTHLFQSVASQQKENEE